MRYVKLGRTGLEVSVVALGCMSYGDPAAGTQTWSLDEDRARPFIKRALDAGINFFDTANVYSLGASEQILGRALADFAARDDVVIATKVWGAMRPGANGAGLSRKSILAELDASLRRLGTDYVDLYQIHRWDPTTPVEETMQALDDAVRAGKVRYLGASSMYAWQFCKAQHVARSNGWTPFVSMQNHYNLLYREEEREMLPLCLDQGIGVLPWSPLARGRLCRAWAASTSRSQNDPNGDRLYTADAESDRSIVDAVAEIAAARGVSMAHVALAWVFRHPAVTAPIVGATREEHLDDAIAATDVTLDDAEAARLESAYTPRAVAPVLAV
ncbi:MAG TPA: aldo/keto reductase [Ilumatobacter sp.]|nr:aldo/keto reductase [Ilumatobacter sp.]